MEDEKLVTVRVFSDGVQATEYNSRAKYYENPAMAAMALVVNLGSAPVNVPVDLVETVDDLYSRLLGWVKLYDDLAEAKDATNDAVPADTDPMDRLPRSSANDRAYVFARAGDGWAAEYYGVVSHPVVVTKGNVAQVASTMKATMKPGGPGVYVARDGWGLLVEALLNAGQA